MRTVVAGWAAVASLLFIASGARAREYARDGFYLGLGGVAGFEEFNSGDTDVDTAAPGLDFRAGYRFHPHFAAEFDFKYIDSWDVTGIADVKSFAFFGRGKAFLLTGRVQPYAVVGVGAVRDEADVALELFGNTFRGSVTETEFAADFGGGVDFYATDALALYAEASYTLTTGKLKDLPFVPVSLGVQYRF